MIKWLIVLSLIVIPIVFWSMDSFQKNEFKSEPELGKSSIMEVAEEFVKQNSFENESEQKTLNANREITEEEILKELELPDLDVNEKILNNGMQLSADYSQISYDYSAEKLSDQLYLSKLLDFRIKYEKYLTSIDAYIGNKDILLLQNSIIEELKEINQQITILKKYEEIGDEWESVSEYDKYKKFLPSMFTP